MPAGISAFFMVAVCGRASALPGYPGVVPVRQPAHGCHPFRLATSMWQLHYNAKNIAFSVGAGLPAMALAGCQRVRGVGIVGKPTPTGCVSALSPYWLNPAIGIILQPLSTSNDCTGKRFARSLERSLTFQRSGLATREYMQRCPDFDGWRVRRLRRFYGGCAREGFGPAGFPVLTGSPTCVQLPPFRLATIQVVAPVQYRSSS